MNGPQHFREAQEMLDVAASGERTREHMDGSTRHRDVAVIQAMLTARAQVHATLALAAATAEQGDQLWNATEWARVMK